MVTEQVTEPSQPPATETQETEPNVTDVVAEGAEPTEPVAEPQEETAPDFSERLNALRDTPHWEGVEKFLADPETYRQDAIAEGWQEAENRWRPHVEGLQKQWTESSQLRQQAKDLISSVNGRLVKALEAGTLDRDTLGAIFQERDLGKVFAALKDDEIKEAREQASQQASIDGRIAGGFDSLSFAAQTAAKLIQRPSLAKKLSGEIEEAIGLVQSGNPQAGAKVTGIMESAFKAVYEAGVADGQKGQKMASETQQRKGEKPDQGAGSATGGLRPTKKQLMDMPPEEYAKIPAKEREAIFAAE